MNFKMMKRVGNKCWIDDKNLGLEIFNFNLKGRLFSLNCGRHILASAIEILNTEVTNHKTSFKFYYKDLY